LPDEVALPHYGPKVLALAAVGFGAVLCLVVAVAFMRARINALPVRPRTDWLAGAHVAYVVQEIAGIREELQRVLVVLSMMASVFTVQALVLRSALRVGAIQAQRPPVLAYSSEVVLLIGVFLTGVIALVFAPAYTAVIDVSRRLRDGVAEQERQRRDVQSLTAWHETRRMLDEALQLRVTVQESFLAGGAILSPFLASLFAVLTRDK
jgi:hypothetical protein